MAPAKRARGAPLEITPEKDVKSRKLSLTIVPNGGVPTSPDISRPSVPKTPHVLKLECACLALRPAYPKGRLMPCRMPERKKIITHLRSAVEQGGTTQVLYISGMPGTGKTAVCLEALHQLKSQLKGQHKFSLVHVNAMRLAAPVQVFREIADQLLCETTNTHACDNVTELFRSRKQEDPVVVLLIDEVDCLATSTQAVLYKLFDWLGFPNARLVVAAISNTMDLPERLLPRVASRFHIERVDFEPYNKAQLYDILCNRLKAQGALDVFGDVVLRLCAARVAGANGDVRKALQICRRTVERSLQTPENEGTIMVADYDRAEKDLVLANPLSQAVMGLSIKPRRFLSAVVIELLHKDGNIVSLRKATTRFHKVCAVTAVESERGAEPGSALDAMGAAELEGSVSFLTGRLQAMGIINIQASMPSKDVSSAGAVVSLGSLDVQDLTNTLLKSEKDPAICSFLEGENPDAPRVVKRVDDCANW